MKSSNTALKKCFASIVAAVIICSAYLGSIKNTVYADYNQGIVTFVTSLYSDCLGRTPDSAGLDDWCAKLASGQISGKQAAYGFFFSPEFQTNANSMTDDELIDAYYKVFLNRAADPSGKTYWAGQIAGTTNDISILFTGFADSAEFADKCANYGITAGSHIDVPTTTRGTVTSSASASGSIPIDATHFPDSGLREFLSRRWDMNGDGLLDKDEIGNVSCINVSDMGVTDLTGIEYFTELTIIVAENNNLNSIDISNFPNLREIYVYGNNITSIDISNNRYLRDAYYYTLNYGMHDDCDPRNFATSQASYDSAVNLMANTQHYGMMDYTDPDSMIPRSIWCDLNVRIIT